MLSEQAQSLNTIKNLCHGFFTRQGGVSHAPFATLNCSYRVGDEPAHVAKNRSLALHSLGLGERSLMVPSIVHGNNVLVLNERAEPEQIAKIEADALITSWPTHALGVTYADCLPIALAAIDASVIALIHAGWRGLLNGVIEKTLHALHENFGALQLKAVIGPGISREGFEFSGEGLAQFQSRWPQQVSSLGKAHYVYLTGVACAQLSKHVLSVEKVGGWTDCDGERYFSHRRDGGQTGRHLAIIAKK